MMKHKILSTLQFIFTYDDMEKIYMSMCERFSLKFSFRLYGPKGK